MTQAAELSLSEVRARRKAIAAEDSMLADIERRLLEVESHWNKYRAVFLSHAAGGAETVLANITAAAIVAKPTVARTSPYAPGRPPTKNAMILEALSEPCPVWQTATEIKAYIEKQTGKPFKMSSLSPALTALKNSGTIVRDELSVALVERVNKESQTGLFNENEPPTGKTRDGSESQPQQP